jgi:tryptophanyl-tRNA synthetase
MKRLVTGDRPTGPLHLGHYVGSLKNRIGLQDKYETFLFLADYHVLTTGVEKLTSRDLKQAMIDVVKDNLAVGVDPEKVTYYVQSEIPEIFELATIFSMLIKVARLEIVPSLKDMMRDSGIESPSFGLLGYPVLMASDILTVRGEVVPVGKDNQANVEVAREIAQRFNGLFGPTLPIPEPLIGGSVLPGIDGNLKMGKSIGNTINLSDGSAEVKRKVMSMYTDPKRIHPTDPGKVEGNPVFVYHGAFNHNQKEVEDLKDRYRKGKVGDVEVKEKLYLALEDFLAPVREKRSKISDKKVLEILKSGAEKVRPIAHETLMEVRAAMKLPDLS